MGRGGLLRKHHCSDIEQLCWCMHALLDLKISGFVNSNDTRSYTHTASDIARMVRRFFDTKLSKNHLCLWREVLLLRWNDYLAS